MKEMSDMRCNKCVRTSALVSVLLFACWPASAFEADKIPERLAASLGKDVVEAAHPTAKNISLREHKETTKDGLLVLSITMGYEGKVTSRKYTAEITITIDTRKAPPRVMDVVYKDNNKLWAGKYRLATVDASLEKRLPLDMAKLKPDPQVKPVTPLAAGEGQGRSEPREVAKPDGESPRVGPSTSVAQAQTREKLDKAPPQKHIEPAHTLKPEALQPQLGTWELTFEAKVGREPVRVTFFRRDGDQTAGVIEYWADGPSKTLSLFVARVDPSRRIVRFDAREVHSRVEGIFPGTYEATLAADGRSMTKFRNITAGSTGVTSSLRWVKAELPKYSPIIEASLALAGERNLACHQLSYSYVLDGTPVRTGVDQPLLVRLCQSADARTRDLAKARVLYQEFVQQAMGSDAKPPASRAEDDLKRRAEIFKYIAQVVERPDFGSPGDVGKLMTSVGIQNAFDRRLAQMQLAVVQEGMFTRFRKDLREDYQVRGAGPKITLPAAQFAVGYKVAAKRGYITLRNNTAGDLHHCQIITRMTPDKKKMDEVERQVQADNRLGGIFMPLFNVDVKTLADSQMVMVAYHRLEKGVPAFVPLWPKGTTLEVQIAMADATRGLAASVGAWVGTDEGHAEIELDLKKVNEIGGEKTERLPGTETGRTVILGTHTWDIETNQQNGPKVTGLWWHQVSATEQYLASIGGLRLAVVLEKGFDTITQEDLANLRFSDTKLAKNRLTPGTLLAVRTKDGNLAKLKVLGYRASQDFSFPEANLLTEKVRAFFLTKPNRMDYHLEVEWVLYRK